jgi:hypothetical protein
MLRWTATEGSTPSLLRFFLFSLFSKPHLRNRMLLFHVKLNKARLPDVRQHLRRL